jgi:hypothetical protein
MADPKGGSKKLTVHPGTLASLHARNRILQHEPPRALLALRLPNHASLLVGPDIPSEHPSSGKKHVGERLSASGHDGVVVVPADDVRAEKRKDALEVRRLELKVAALRAGRDGDGDGVLREVRDEARDAGQELYVRPARVLGCGALREVVVDCEGDVGEEGEEVGGRGALGCGRVSFEEIDT